MVATTSRHPHLRLLIQRNCRLHVASVGFHHRLSKKKHCEAIDDDEKYLPIDALGIVMMQHGEEFGNDSAFGMSHVIADAMR